MHAAAEVPMIHISEHEAEKLLQRLQREQTKIREQAIKEEQEVKQKEKNVMSFLVP